MEKMELRKAALRSGPVRRIIQAKISQKVPEMTIPEQFDVSSDRIRAAEFGGGGGFRTFQEPKSTAECRVQKNHANVRQGLPGFPLASRRVTQRRRSSTDCIIGPRFHRDPFGGN